MKKVLLGFLVVIMTLFVACEAKTDYEYKDGVMYENKKPATGTFEFKSGDYKVKSQFVDGVPEGVLEKYYLDGKLMIKDVFEGGEIIQEEIYYKNGNLMGFSDAEGVKMYYDDGQLLMSTTYSTGETILYHENGNPLMTVGDTESAIYNENNEMLFKVRNGEAVDIGASLRNLEDGSFELVKDNKVVAKVDANGEIINYLYATGETLMRANDVTAATEIFFKNGTSFFKAEGNNFTLNYKDGKPLYKLEGDTWKFYNEEGDEIISNFEIITDIKKID